MLRLMFQIQFEVDVGFEVDVDVDVDVDVGVDVDVDVGATATAANAMFNAGPTAERTRPETQCMTTMRGGPPRRSSQSCSSRRGEPAR